MVLAYQCGFLCPHTHVNHRFAIGLIGHTPTVFKFFRNVSLQLSWLVGKHKAYGLYHKGLQWSWINYKRIGLLYFVNNAGDVPSKYDPSVRACAPEPDFDWILARMDFLSRRSGTLQLYGQFGVDGGILSD
jgi:hypothetical protein